MPPRRYRGQRYWARPLAGLRRSGARACCCRARARRARRQSHRAACSPATGAATGSSRALHDAGFANQPTSEHARRRPRAARRLHHGRRSAARRRPTSRRPDEIDALPAVPARGAAPARSRARRGRPSARSAGTPICARAARWGWRAARRCRASATARAPRVRGRHHAARLLSPEPAEHVHGQAHAADAAARCSRKRAGSRTRNRAAAGAYALPCAIGTTTSRAGNAVGGARGPPRGTRCVAIRAGTRRGHEIMGARLRRSAEATVPRGGPLTPPTAARAEFHARNRVGEHLTCGETSTRVRAPASPAQPGLGGRFGRGAVAPLRV